MAILIQIDEGPDQVEILGQKIARPSWMGVSEWLLFWEKAKRATKETYY